MSPTFKEYVFDFSDLGLLSIVCGVCRCEVVIDCSEHSCRSPRACPSCLTTFDQGFNIGVDAFKEAYLNLSTRPNGAAKSQIRIRRQVNLPEG